MPSVHGVTSQGRKKVGGRGWGGGTAGRSKGKNFLITQETHTSLCLSAHLKPMCRPGVFQSWDANLICVLGCWPSEPCLPTPAGVLDHKSHSHHYGVLQ